MKPKVKAQPNCIYVCAHIILITCLHPDFSKESHCRKPNCFKISFFSLNISEQNENKVKSPLSDWVGGYEKTYIFDLQTNNYRFEEGGVVDAIFKYCEPPGTNYPHQTAENHMHTVKNSFPLIS